MTICGLGKKREVREEKGRQYHYDIIFLAKQNINFKIGNYVIVINKSNNKMAVPKKKTSPSKRGMRRGGNGTFKMNKVNVIVDKETGEEKLAHHISPNGFYKNKRVLEDTTKKKEEKKEE